MPSIPKDVEQVILTALNKEPQRRFGRIEAFARALELAAQSAIATISGTEHKKILEENTLEAALIGPLGRFVLGMTKVTIGRSPDNMIVLGDSQASSHHAEIRPEGPYYNLVDLGSTNGTFVNEQRVSKEMPRPLQSGDTIRVGGSRFTFEVSDAVLDRTIQAAPPLPLDGSGAIRKLDFAANTGYGMGNLNYGDQLNYQETIPAQFTPPNPSYPDQQPLYNQQQPAYTPPSPLYNQQQPVYNPPSPPIYNQGYTPPPPMYNPQQPAYKPPQQSSPMRMILLAAIALVVILAAVGGFAIYQNHQTDLAHGYATATAQTFQHNATVTQQNIAATATSVVNATATAMVTSHYPPFTNVGVNDSLTSANSDWNSSSICQFTSTGYQVSIAQANNFQYCVKTGTFGEIAYQVTMNIQQGDCGGLIFRHIDNNNFFGFYVCQNGTYNLFDFVNTKEGALYTNDKASSAIQQGLNSQNTIAITVQGDTVNMYVNKQNIDVATNPILQNTFSQGAIGLLALDQPDSTSVTYTNALVWTAS